MSNEKFLMIVVFLVFNLVLINLLAEGLNDTIQKLELCQQARQKEKNYEQR